MKVVVKFGLTGVYVLMFSFLGRLLLDGKRTIGIEELKWESFLTICATILAYLVVLYLVETWKALARLQAPSQVRSFTEVSLAIMRRRLWRIAIFAVLAGLSLVILDCWSVINFLTPYSAIYFFLSFAGAILVQAMLTAVDLRRKR